MGCTEVAQRQPGSNTARPMVAPPILINSRRPIGNLRTSSGVPKFLSSAFAAMAIAC
jgi:hypothetical protein